MSGSELRLLTSVTLMITVCVYMFACVCMYRMCFMRQFAYEHVSKMYALRVCKNACVRVYVYVHCKRPQESMSVCVYVHTNVCVCAYKGVCFCERLLGECVSARVFSQESLRHFQRVNHTIT